MLDDVVEYLRGLPWRDWASPLITSLFALFGVLYVQHDRHKVARDQQTAEDEKAKRDEEQRYQHSNQGMVVAQTQDLTERLRVLMDGYENRVADVSEELVQTKARLETIQAEFRAHQAICRRCSNYGELSNHAS